MTGGHRTETTVNPPEPYTYTDPDGATLTVSPVIRFGATAISLLVQRPDVPEASAAVHVPLTDMERLVAAIRAASGGQPAADLTAEEARDLADTLSTDLYQAQDAVEFVRECCDIADREGRQPTTADVRKWLKGAQCGRQLLVVADNERDERAAQANLDALADELPHMVEAEPAADTAPGRDTHRE